MRLLLNEQGFNGQPCYLGAAGFHRLVVTCLGQTIPLDEKQQMAGRRGRQFNFKISKNY